MENLTQIELSDLYDLLAHRTNQYMKMLSDGATRLEFNQCRESIINIQAEIHARKIDKLPGQESRPNNPLSSGYAGSPGN